MSRAHASSVDADNAWGQPQYESSPQPQPIEPADIVAKELVVKTIAGKQEGLRALLQRVKQVQAEADKLKSGNETLQTYIDNLTRNNAMAAAAGR